MEKLIRKIVSKYFLYCHLKYRRYIDNFEHSFSFSLVLVRGSQVKKMFTLIQNIKKATDWQLVHVNDRCL